MESSQPRKRLRQENRKFKSCQGNSEKLYLKTKIKKRAGDYHPVVGCQLSICKALGSRFGSNAGGIRTNGTELQVSRRGGKMDLRGLLQIVIPVPSVGRLIRGECDGTARWGQETQGRLANCSATAGRPQLASALESCRTIFGPLS